ncbi:MAG: ATP-binding protein [Actinomycetota bacterium]|nr:ATP-binding protein [Actinomycetota bacterium]
MEDLEMAARAVSVGLQAGLAVLVWGPPGTGKTSALLSIAAGLDWEAEVVVGSIREPTDIAGLPIRHGDGVVLAPPGWALRFIEADRAGRGSLLVLDELTTSPAAVQAAMLRVVCERVVGDLRLPGTTSIVAAANPPEMAADGWDLTAPLANRFCHLDWPIDVRAWASGTASGWCDASPPVRLEPTWLESLPAWRAKVAGFVLARPELLHRIPPDPAGRGRAWPSPRSWEMGARAAAAGYSVDPRGDLALFLISGCVGDGPAAELLAWVSKADLPDPERLLADPSQLDLPMRGDRLHASLLGLVSALGRSPTQERWEAAWAVLHRVVEHGAADVAALAAHDLLRLRDQAWALPERIEVFSSILVLTGEL